MRRLADWCSFVSRFILDIKLKELLVHYRGLKEELFGIVANVVLLHVFLTA